MLGAPMALPARTVKRTPGKMNAARRVLTMGHLLVVVVGALSIDTEP
jgi:hypothetical protein